MRHYPAPILDRKIRFALVGCGRIAKNHFGAIEQHGPHLPLATDLIVVDAFAEAVVAEVVEEPGIVEKLKASNLIPVGNSPKEFAEFLKAEKEKFSALVKAVGIKAE